MKSGKRGRNDTVEAGMGRPHMYFNKLADQTPIIRENVYKCKRVYSKPIITKKDDEKLKQNGQVIANDIVQENQNEEADRSRIQIHEQVSNNGSILQSHRNGVEENQQLEIPTETQEWPPVFGCRHVVLAIIGMFIFLLDIFTDWLLAYRYYKDQDMTPFVLTVLFIVIPSVISCIISIIWYQMEHKWTDYGTNKVNLFFRILFTVLQLGRIYRLSEFTVYVIRSWRRCTPDESRRRHLREKAMEQKLDSAILGLIDGFLESALQLLLQLYLSMKFSLDMDARIIVSMVLSWLSTGLTLTCYYRDNRKARREKENIGNFGSAVYLLWRICELGPRFLLLAMCGVIFMPWCFIPVLAHFALMVVFYMCQKPEIKGICCSNTSGYPFLVLISYISIFCFINLKDGSTKWIATIYYVIFYIENAVMTSLVIWYSYTKYKILDNWTNAVYMVFIGAILHLLCQLIFYKCFHPK